MATAHDILNDVYDAASHALRSTGAGGGVDPVGLKDIAGDPVNPASEDTLATIADRVVDGATPMGKGLQVLAGVYKASDPTLTDGQIYMPRLTSAAILLTQIANASIAVTGSVTANAGTNLNTSALALETGGNLATIAGKDFATQTTLALIKAKTDNLDLAITALRDALRGTSSKTLTDLDTRLSDIDTGKLEEATFTGRIGEVQASPTANTVLARLKDLLTGIVLAAGTNAIGKLSANSGVDIGDVDVLTMPAVTHGKTLKSKSGTVSSSGNNTVLSAVASKKITVFAVKLEAATTTALTCAWQDGAGGTELWRSLIQTPASVVGGDNLAVTPPGYLFQGGTNTLLNLNLSSAVTVHYAIAYWEE